MNPAIPATPARLHQSSPAIRILVVDDDQEMIHTLKDVLRLKGWEPAGAGSGEQAIEALNQEPFHLVLMDFRMAGLDGVAALKRIRVQHPTLPVLLMTAHASREVIMEAEAQGAVRVLQKPVEPAVLLQTVELSLRRAES